MSFSLIGGSSFSDYNIGNPSFTNNVSEITVCVLLEKLYSTTNNYAYHPLSKWNSGYNVNASFVLYQFDNYDGKFQTFCKKKVLLVVWAWVILGYPGP